MMWSSYTTLMISSIILHWTTHPMKGAMCLAVSCTVTTMIIHTEEDMVFFLFLLVMMFIGGVALTFMVVSSLYPNEKLNSSPFFSDAKGTITVMLGSSTTWLSETWLSGFEKVPQISTEPFNCFFLMLLVSYYFYGFLKIITWEKASMRSN